MAIFAVLLEEHSEKAVQRIKKAYPDAYYEVSPTAFLVQYEGVTRDIVRTIGMQKENNIASGIVLKMGRAYTGYADATLWEWLERDKEAA